MSNLGSNEGGMPRDGALFAQFPSVFSKVHVVLLHEPARGVDIGPHNWMHRLAKESQKLIIQSVEQIKSRIVEHPVVFPISPVFPMLANIASRIRYTPVC
jgi:hypothetical protein